MKKRIAALALFSALSCIIPLFAGGKTETSLTVAAGAGLTDALNACAALYADVEPSVRITPVFGASGSLQAQIFQGAPIDVFISASPRFMDALEKQGLLSPGTRRNLLANSIVLVVPKDSKGIDSFEDVPALNHAFIALGEPSSVPVGQYAEEVLRFYGILEDAKKKAVYGKDVRQVLSYVENGDAAAGIVYMTDALSSVKVRVAAAAPPVSHAPVLFPAAAMQGGPREKEARAFLDWLSSPEAQAVFASFGFKEP